MILFKGTIMPKYSYLVTFSNVFEHKYFKEHLNEFFEIYAVPELNLKSTITTYSNTFIEIKTKYFNPNKLLKRFPNIKITKKVPGKNKTQYIKLK